jgi:hypothetical protein
MHKLYTNDNLKVYSLKEDKRLVKSPQSQEESQYGTDIQLREYPYTESFENIKNNNDIYLFIILIIILLFLFYSIINKFFCSEMVIIIETNNI